MRTSKKKPLRIKSKNCWLLRAVMVASCWTQEESDVPVSNWLLVRRAASCTICGGKRASRWRKLLLCDDSPRSCWMQVTAI